jgi:hypothetical protein
LSLNGRATGSCQMRMENVHLRRLTEPAIGKVTTNAALTAKNCTFENLEIQVTGTGSAIWENCLINGKASIAGAVGAELIELQKLAPSGFTH